MGERLENKVAMITGGNSGIGEAIVHRFASEGAKIVFCARREEEGTAVEKAVRDEGGEAAFFACDVTSPEQVETLVQKAVERYGKLDVLVNNAGSASPHQWPNEPDDSWDSILKLNLGSAFYLSRACWPHLIEAGAGSIINMSSFSAVAGIGKDQFDTMGGFQPSASYQVSKAGLEGLTLHLAGRGGEHGIRVNAIRPGRILTRQWEEAAGEEFLFWPLYKQIQMLKQHGRAEDVANAALYLASDEARFVTAEIIEVNGGAIGKV